MVVSFVWVVVHIENGIAPQLFNVIGIPLAKI